MHLVSTSSVNDAVIKLCKLIREKGIESSTKANVGTIATNIQVYETLFEISNPRDRYLDIVGRNNNIYAMIAECLWAFSGDNKINPYLSFFLPRATEFSDDGETWRGAYGPRIFGNNQIQSALDGLKVNPLSRQEVVAIYDPNLDSRIHLPNGTKDIPCNNMLYFYAYADSPNKLNLHVHQRSGDIIWGIGSINIFMWTILQEIMASSLGMELGNYNHYVNNLHVYKSYEVAYKQFEAIIENEEKSNLVRGNEFSPIYGFLGFGQKEIKTFFSNVVTTITLYIEDRLNQEDFMKSLNSAMNTLPTTDNAIIDMIKVVANYCIKKKVVDLDHRTIYNDISDYNLWSATLNSKF